MRIITIFLLLMTIPFAAYAWQGKVVAVDSPTSLIILKDGQTPVKVNISGIETASGIDAAKGKLETSSIALMKDADVTEIKSDDSKAITADIKINGNSLANELINTKSFVKIGGSTKQQTSISDSAAQVLPDSPELNNEKQNSDEIISKLSEQNSEPSIDSSQLNIVAAPVQTQTYNTQLRPAPVVRYVQVQQPQQQLGFWPARETPPPYAVQPQPVVIQKNENVSVMRQPGDIAKEEHELAVRVNKRPPAKKNKGFFIPKKKSETFVGVSVGSQYSTKSKTEVPYSSFGPAGGLAVRHFYPSGLGIGGDMMISGTSGRSGTISASSNATNGTSFDYKSKSFMTYTFTGSLLYRFYTDSKFTPYIAAHGGYTFFDFPATEFGLSDGAPVAGGGLGFLYEFDSGFTIGSDVKYLKTFGTKSHDPDGFLNTTINFGYTFD